MRKATVITWLTLLCAGIIALFWRNEWIYNLPTPVPRNYKSVNPGKEIALPGKWDPANGRPLFLHFFNPDCPCSRFNVDHFKSLVKQYDGKVNFEIIVMSNKEYTVKDIQDKFGINVPVLFDTAIAVACGVYSTPQAVIIDAGQKLFIGVTTTEAVIAPTKKPNTQKWRWIHCCTGAFTLFSTSSH